MRAVGRRRRSRAADGGGLRSALTRYRWPAMALAGLAAVALGTAAILLAKDQDRRLVAGGCGMVSCSAALPGSTGAPSATAQASPRDRVTTRPSTAHHRAPAAPTRSPSAPLSAKPSPARSPAPSPSGSPTPSASPTPTPVTATVSYTVDQRWPGGFQGHFTIVNNGTTPLAGWALTATLPGDQIDSVWSASYSVNGNDLTLTPPSDQPSIAPGASASAYFTASGSTVRPTGCVFNSQACSG